MNSKRIKISLGIVLILVFAAILDVYYPVNGFSMTVPARDYYSVNLEIINSAIENYYNLTGTLPEYLTGGDEYSYECAKRLNSPQIDPLIEKGILNSYPENACLNMEAKRSLIDFHMHHPEAIMSFGKTGRSICNVASLNGNSVINYISSHQSNPFVDQFIYEVPGNSCEYSIFIICDPAKMTEEFSDYLSGIEKYDVEFLSNLNDVEGIKIILYGYNCFLVNGQWIYKPVCSGV